MNFEYFIAQRITFKSQRSFSRLIVRLAIVAIALSLGIMLISVAVVKGFQGEITDKVIGFGSHIQISKSRFSKSFEQEPVIFDSSLIQKVKEIKGVNHIQPFATKPGIMKTGEAIEGIVLKGVDTSFNWNFIKSRMVKGRLPDLSPENESDDILISKDLGSRLQLDTGDAVLVYFIQYPTRVRKFTVTGVYETGLEEVDNIFVIGDIRHIIRLNDWGEQQIGGYEVLLHDLDILEEVNEEVRLMLSVYQDTRTIRELFPQIFDWLGLLDINVRIILLLMCFVAGINMITALLIMILERSQLIGTLKALGASNMQIIRLFMINAIYLIGLGIIIGDIFGLGALYLQDSLRIVSLPQESYYVDTVPIKFMWFEFILINAGTFIFCSLMMFLPALLVNNITPVKALRFE